MIMVKPGVVFRSLQPQIYGIFGTLNLLFGRYQQDCVITSANDGEHMEGSLHYKDLAIDIRTKNLPSHTVKVLILAELKHILGSDYDVLLESTGLENEHMHIEWDPKNA
jgi:hypothetical protein